MRKIFPKKGYLASESKTLIEIRVRMEERLLEDHDKRDHLPQYSDSKRSFIESCSYIKNSFSSSNKTQAKHHTHITSTNSLRKLLLGPMVLETQFIICIFLKFSVNV